MAICTSSTFSQAEFFGFDGGFSGSVALGSSSAFPNSTLSAVAIDMYIPTGFTAGFSFESAASFNAQTVYAGFMIKSEMDKGYPVLNGNVLYSSINGYGVWGFNLNAFVFIFSDTNFPSNVSPFLTLINLKKRNSDRSSELQASYGFEFTQALFTQKSLYPLLGIGYSTGESNILSFSVSCNIKM